MPRLSHTAWTFVITAIAVFMAVLDNLVVTTALLVGEVPIAVDPVFAAAAAGGGR
jgi:hypothetical protein